MNFFIQNINAIKNALPNVSRLRLKAMVFLFVCIVYVNAIPKKLWLRCQNHNSTIECDRIFYGRFNKMWRWLTLMIYRIDRQFEWRMLMIAFIEAFSPRLSFWINMTILCMAYEKIPSKLNSKKYEASNY